MAEKNKATIYDERPDSLMAEHETTETWDEAHEAGFWGTKMDPNPNEVYTVASVAPKSGAGSGDAAPRGPGRPRKDE